VAASAEASISRLVDLAAILYQAARPGVGYHFDDTITALDQDQEGVMVTLEKSPPRHFDLVVGADGLHSVVRQLAFAQWPTDCIR
jgi:2-polyprenyl-6-methoxyphenol hydroxylase-like FAD-dependent oxidoreductase